MSSRRFAGAGLMRRPGARGGLSGGSSSSAAASPLDIFAADLCCWYRADTVTNVAGAASAMADKGLNGNNLTQGTGSARPTIGTGGLGGQAYLTFTAASSQILSLASGATGFGTGAGYYAWSVVDGVLSTSGQVIISAQTAAGNHISGVLLFSGAASVTQWWFQSTTGSENRTGGPDLGGNPSFLEGWIDWGADTTNLRNNGAGLSSAALVTANAPLAATITRIGVGGAVGGASYLDGRFYECGIAQIYSAAQATLMDAYVLDRYGI